MKKTKKDEIKEPYRFGFKTDEDLYGQIMEYQRKSGLPKTTILNESLRLGLPLFIEDHKQRIFNSASTDHTKTATTGTVYVGNEPPKDGSKLKSSHTGGRDS